MPHTYSQLIFIHNQPIIICLAKGGVRATMTALIPSITENENEQAICFSIFRIIFKKKPQFLMALRLEAINKGKEIHCRGNEIPP